MGLQELQEQFHGTQTIYTYVLQLIHGKELSYQHGNLKKDLFSFKFY